jgi:hypothetical protein
VLFNDAVSDGIYKGDYKLSAVFPPSVTEATHCLLRKKHAPISSSRTALAKRLEI